MNCMAKELGRKLLQLLSAYFYYRISTLTLAMIVDGNLQRTRLCWAGGVGVQGSSVLA